MKRTDKLNMIRATLRGNTKAIDNLSGDEYRSKYIIYGLQESDTGYNPPYCEKLLTETELKEYHARRGWLPPVIVLKIEMDV